MTAGIGSHNITDHGGAIDQVAGRLIRVNDNGGWCWFQGPRCLVDGNRILVGSVASSSGVDGATRGGNIEVSVLDLASLACSVRVLDPIDADDHNAPALLRRPDGRYLAAYSNHNTDQLTRYRVSTLPGDPTSWGSGQSVDNGARTTYSNLVHLADEGLTYNFSRTLDWDPNYTVSADLGRTWSAARRLIRGPAGPPLSRPYVTYASNGRDRVFFVATESHPNSMNTSIFAGYLRDGRVHRMDGSVPDRTGDGSDGAPLVTQFTPVFRAGTEGLAGERTHAWTSDIALDPNGNPSVTFTVRVETGRADRPVCLDHRFCYARWTGSAWVVHELTHAGAGLYAGEEDYTGLAAIDPDDPNRVYASTPIDPRSGRGHAHHEIYEGTTTDGGDTWTWQPLTIGSTVDNLRPFAPAWDGTKRVVFWLRGTYASFRDYRLAVVGLLRGPVSP